MQYLPTIDIHAPGIQSALYKGQLKLQPGQWLICGAGNSKPCRFVSASPGQIWVVHWQGTPAATTAHFMRSIQANKRGS